MWFRTLALAITLALSIKDGGRAIIAVNPGSMLGSKMVKQAFGVAGGDLRMGAQILCRAALSDEFAQASGQYFENDSGRFASPHSDALNPQKSEEVVRVIEAKNQAQIGVRKYVFGFGCGEMILTRIFEQTNAVAGDQRRARRA